MNIFGSLKKAYTVYKYERGANYELGNSLSGTAVSNMFGHGGDSVNVIEEYNGFAWKCINVRAENLADQLIYVERKVGDKWQEDEGHEFNAVLQGVDGDYDLYELIEAHSISMDLYGESFWYFSKGETYGKPMGRFLLDPNCMTVYVANNRVTGYIYQKDGTNIVFDVDEILHFRIYDPSRPFRGVGPMQKAGWFVRSARYTYTYINNFLENNAIPAGVIVASGAVDDSDWELFKQQWQARYNGIDNAGKTGYLRGQDIKFLKTGLSLGEVDFEKMKSTSNNDVMAMFSMPGALLGIFEDVNRASSVSVRQLFALTFTSPALKRIKSKLSRKVTNWYGPQFRIGATNPVPEDREMKLEEFKEGVGKWFTPDEAREAYGYEPLPSGTGKLLTAPQEAPANRSIGKIRIKSVTSKASFPYEMKESFRGQTEDIQIKFEQQVYQKSHPVLKSQMERVISQLTPKKVVDAKFSVEEETNQLTEELYPLFIGLAAEQGLLAARFAGNPDTTFEVTPVMKKYIESSLRKALKGFNEETQAKIADAVATGLVNGDPVARIAKQIKAIYDDVLGVKTPGYRIERIARTEVIKTSNEVTEAAYKQSGVVRKKEWFANPGHCQFCASLNGSTVQLGAVFVPKEGKIEGVDGGTHVNSYEDVKHPPVHPACRCTLIPVIED